MILFGTKVLPFTHFPNGETKLDEEEIVKRIYGSGNDITLKYESDKDLMRLYMLKRFLDTHGYQATLLIAYMPYSRMDRSENGSAFTLKYIADFINTLDFKRVTVMEPHSDVTMALLNNAEAIYPTREMLGYVMAQVGYNENEGDLIFYPDAGAQKRYSKFFNGVHSAVGIKTRDFVSGEITNLVVAGIEEQPRKVIIVDDLCSGGKTFLDAGKLLREMGAQEVYLLVTHVEHNIFARGMFKEDSPITKVFGTDTMINWNDVPEPLKDRLEIVKRIGASSGE